MSDFLWPPWAAARQASLSITNSQSLLKLMSIESVMPSNHLILRHALLLQPSVFPNIKVFSNESALRIRWPKYWNFSFNISPSTEYSGLICLRIDWLDLLVVQGTLKSSPTPQFKSINSLVLSFLYSPTLISIHDHWKNHSLDLGRGVVKSILKVYLHVPGFSLHPLLTLFIIFKFLFSYSLWEFLVVWRVGVFCALRLFTINR